MIKSKIRPVYTIVDITLLIFLMSGISMAEYDPDEGGWTEVIDCPTSSWDECPFYHPKFYWGGTGPNLSYISPAGWSTYATTGDSSMNCGSWVNGGIVGGATYEEGQPSIAQGVDVRINTTWWDFVNVDFSTTCGHQHVSTYVWGWRYNGNYWQFEFVNAHQRSAYLNDQGLCVFKAAGHPDFPPPDYEGFAFGPETITIQNSPYAVLFTKTQATSHYSAGCGYHGCFHPVKVSATYSGGPGVNKGKLQFDSPTDELTFGSTPVVEFNPDSIERNQGSLTIGGSATLLPGQNTVLRVRSVDDTAKANSRISDSK